ncbi:MAG: HD domain-containing protein [Candidatus Cloacimonetes bacterium]|nr:HD domain-containing protein [Candidatus Cloacimonadota bacterium]
MEKFDINNYKDFNKAVQQLSELVGKQDKHIKQLIHIGESLSAKKSLVNIFTLILNEAMDYANADGGTIYFVSNDRKFLDFKLTYNKALNIEMGNEETPITWPSIPLYLKNGLANMSYMVSYVYHTKESKTFEDVYDQKLFDNTGTQKFDTRNKYRSQSMAAIPLINHEDEVMGVIQLINAMDKDGNCIPFGTEHIKMLNSLASQAAISLSNKRLIESLEELLLQFIKSIATAIDKKSKYTAGHVKRVATLTEEIARRINEDENGYFKNVYFNEDQLQEISMAGWMHDVGKIVTPECIMDKSTKLQKIIDRVELIKVRGELIKQVIKKDINKLKLDRTLTKEKEKELIKISNQIDHDISLIEKMNFGVENFSDENKKEIERMYSFSYISEGQDYRILTDDEKKNLMIYRGTLTDEEFDIMKEHAQVTWEMLSPLQFPKKYENVPLYAAAHHERLDGGGYPHNLSENQIPLQARIIAVADVFEALLSERPYKDGKKVSEAMKIIAFMVQDHKLDKAVVDILLDSGLHISFAQKIAKPEQVDNVDIKKIKSIYHIKK